MSETADIIAAQIEKFDALREAFFAAEARLFLLKKGQHTQKFTVVAQVGGGWYVRWNEYRQQMRIAVATMDAEFVDRQAQASFFAYGVPDGENQLDVYKTDDDRRDKVAPDGTNPYWKFYVLRAANERFTVP